jgi:hypothetical protein
VTINSRGSFALSKAAYRQLGHPQAVQLLYDPTEQIIGFRAAATISSDAYAIRHHNGGRRLDVSGRAFTKYYGIDTTVARRRPAVMEGDVLCVDLKHEGTVVTSNRARGVEHATQRKHRG